MYSDFISIEDDGCYIEQHIINDNGYCLGYDSRLIITKEAFIACYEEWIVNNERSNQHEQ